MSNKRYLLSAYLNESVSEKYKSPADYINYLRRNNINHQKILICVKSLRIELTNKPITWVQEFGEIGVDQILSSMRECFKK